MEAVDRLDPATCSASRSTSVRANRCQGFIGTVAARPGRELHGWMTRLGVKKSRICVLKSHRDIVRFETSQKATKQTQTRLAELRHELMPAMARDCQVLVKAGMEMHKKCNDYVIEAIGNSPQREWKSLIWAAFERDLEMRRAVFNHIIDDVIAEAVAGCVMAEAEERFIGIH